MRRYGGEASPGGDGRTRRGADGRRTRRGADGRRSQRGADGRRSHGWPGAWVWRWVKTGRSRGWIETGVTAGLLAAGCGTAAPATFRPAGQAGGAHGTAGAAAGGPGGGGPAAGTPAGTTPAGTAGPPLRWPPFGRDVHIVMPGWLPPDATEAAAVITAKDFLLAVLYAEYRGNQDDRWTAYATGTARTVQRSILAQPSVTNQSFTGTLIFSRLSAFPDPVVRGAVDVSECFDNAMSTNISLATGKAIPGHGPASQHYYRNTDVVARRNGHWQVVSTYPVIYYPQAAECKP